MADPLSAIGAASSILTLLEFSWKLFSSVKEVHHSATGQSNDNLVLEAITRDIEQLNAAITDSGAFAHTPLEKLIKESNSIAADLLTVLDKLKHKEKKTPWSSFTIALQDVWKKRQIEAFIESISRIQNRVASHLEMLILNNVMDISKKTVALEKRHGSLSDEMRDQFDALKDQIRKATETLLPAKGHAEPPGELRVKPVGTVVFSGRTEDLESLSKKLFDFHKLSCSIQFRQSLLETLSFPSMKSRETNVAEAHDATYEWIFKSTTEDGTSEIHFLNWLQTEEDIYWVHGKPGSGKSTLMKFIARHPKTLTALRHWSGDKILLMATSYFWYAGTKMQKSQVGMLRSLLFDLVRHHREFGSYIEELLAAEGKAHNADWVNSRKDLLRILQGVIRREPDIRFFFVIDGLDEYEEEGLTTLDLIRFIQDLASNSNVKMCVASRPWSEFVDSFGSNNPRFAVQLHDLTRPDILRFVDDKFNTIEAFRQAKQSYESDDFYNNLTQEIFERSRGVFLWVHLVVKDLLQGLIKRDDVTLLRTRLARFPPDLDDFFKHMIDTIDPIYLPHTALWLEVARNSVENFVVYSFLDEISTEPEIWRNKGKPMSDQAIALRKERIERQLDGRCKGLLEIARSSDLDRSYHPYYSDRVDFIHRTVHEFLSSSKSIRIMIDLHVKEDVVRLNLCKAQLMFIKHQPLLHDDKGTESLFDSFLTSFSQLEACKATFGSQARDMLMDAEQQYQHFDGRPFCRDVFLSHACNHGIKTTCELLDNAERTNNVMHILLYTSYRSKEDSTQTTIRLSTDLKNPLPALEALLERALSFDDDTPLKDGPLFLKAIIEMLLLMQQRHRRRDPNPDHDELCLKVIGLILAHGVSINTPMRRGPGTTDYSFHYARDILRGVATKEQLRILDQAAARGRRRRRRRRVLYFRGFLRPIWRKLMMTRKEARRRRP